MSRGDTGTPIATVGWYCDSFRCAKHVDVISLGFPTAAHPNSVMYRFAVLFSVSHRVISIDNLIQAGATRLYTGESNGYSYHGEVLRGGGMSFKRSANGVNGVAASHSDTGPGEVAGSGEPMNHG